MLVGLSECTDSLKRVYSRDTMLMMTSPWNVYFGVRIYTIKGLTE